MSLFHHCATSHSLRCLPFFGLVFAVLLIPAGLSADFVDDYDPSLWSFDGGSGDGSFANDGLTLLVTGSDDGTGPDDTLYLIIASGTGLVQFDWSYSSLDTGDWDQAGYYLNGSFFQLADNASQGSGSFSFNVNAGDQFGFYVRSVDSIFGSGNLSISNFDAPASIPEPGTLVTLTLMSAACLLRRRRK